MHLFSAAVVDCWATEDERSRQRSLRLACREVTVACSWKFEALVASRCCSAAAMDCFSRDVS